MKKILVIEDDKSIRQALVNKLSNSGLNVLYAGNGEEGLEKALREKPDLILLDIIMPKMDGITMLGRLREDERGKNVKVIILTNLSDNEKVAESMRLGSYEYLVKSNWKIEDVIQKIKEKLEM